MTAELSAQQICAGVGGEGGFRIHCLGSSMLRRCQFKTTVTNIRSWAQLGTVALVSLADNTVVNETSKVHTDMEVTAWQLNRPVCCLVWVANELGRVAANESSHRRRQPRVVKQFIYVYIGIVVGVSLIVASACLYRCFHRHSGSWPRSLELIRRRSPSLVRLLLLLTVAQASVNWQKRHT